MPGSAEFLFYPVIIPLLTGLVVLVLPGRVRRMREGLALTGSLTAAYAAWMIYMGGETGATIDWFTVGDFTWAFDLRADGLGSFILLAAHLFTVLITVYSIGYMADNGRLREYYTYLLWTSAGASVVLLADNLILLLIGWEVTTALLFFLVTIGGASAREAAGKSFVIIGFSDGALLLGILVLQSMTGTFSMQETTGVPTGYGIGAAAYLLLLVPAIVKAGAMPGHSWIPDTADAAPVSVAAYLPACLDKLLGIYLLARITLYMFDISGGIQMLLLIIGAVTIIAAVFMALVQHSLKKLLAFHAVSQVGYMFLGIGTGVPAGIVGGLFHMLNNAIYKSCLFLCAGAVEKKTGTDDLEKLGGLAAAMPVTFGAALIAACAISGVPPLNGFASKWLIYQGTIEIGRPVFLVAAMFGSALTLASFIKVIYSVFLGRRGNVTVDDRKLPATLGFPMIVLAGACVIFGVFAWYPIRILIGSAMGVDFGGAGDLISLAGGMWQPALATLLLLISLGVGIIVYLIASSGSTRITSVFVGGEKFDKEDIRFPGTGFYSTISDLSVLKTLYADAEKGVYDLYVLGGRYGRSFINILRDAHNGVVSTYLAFMLVGLVYLLFFLIG